MAISEPLARVLAAGRTQFNARFTEARHRYPMLEPASFSAFLATGVDALVCAVAPLAPERVPSVVLVAYDMALELVSQELAGPRARTDLLDRVWQDLAPRYPRLLADNPAELLGVLTNAAVTLGKMSHVRTEQWLSGMAELSPRVDSMASLRALGQIMAWRSGVAHYRTGAMAVADQLPEALALAAVGAPAHALWADVRARLLVDPWWSPHNKAQPPATLPEQGKQVGQFTGFGGVFRVPPEIRASNDGFCVKSADQYFLLRADAFGAVFLPADREEFIESTPHDRVNAPVLQGSTLAIDGRHIELDLPTDGLTLAWNTHTVAVSSLYTFSIRLFPRSCP